MQLKVQDDPPWLEEMASIVPGEMADAIIARMRVSMPDEDLPTAVNYRRKSMEAYFPTLLLRVELVRRG